MVQSSVKVKHKPAWLMLPVTLRCVSLTLLHLTHFSFKVYLHLLTSYCFYFPNFKTQPLRPSDQHDDQGGEIAQDLNTAKSVLSQHKPNYQITN